MSMSNDFKDFIAKGNVLDLAVAVVIGGAFGKIVTALVEGIIMPLVGMAVPGGDWRTMMTGPFKTGSVLGAVVDFICIALVVFLVFVKGFGSLKKKEQPAYQPDTKTCPACQETVLKVATRCKHCTSPV
jgi:large conductance mechanosensitive channel